MKTANKMELGRGLKTAQHKKIFDDLFKSLCGSIVTQFHVTKKTLLITRR